MGVQLVIVVGSTPACKPIDSQKAQQASAFAVMELQRRLSQVDAFLNLGQKA